MSAPTHSSRPQHVPAVRLVGPVSAASTDAATVRIAPLPPAGHLSTAPRTAQRIVLRAHSPLGTAVDAIARLGTAVTLAALLVLTATALGAADSEPAPTGAASTER